LKLEILLDTDYILEGDTVKSKMSSKLILMTMGVIVTFLLVSSFFISVSYTDDIIVICNESVTESSLDAGDLERIYLGKKSKWNDNKKIRLTVLRGKAETKEIHESFLKQYVNKTMSQFGHYWASLSFTGKGIPPKPFETESDLIKYVSETEGAIGYVRSSTQPENIKTIKIISEE